VVTQTQTAGTECDLSVLVHTTGTNGKPVAETAKVVDVSSSGARLSWVRTLKQTGQVAEIEHRGRRARFRVAWVGQPGTKHEGEVGVESLEPGNNIWGLPVEESKSHAPLSSLAALPTMEPKRADAVPFVPSWSGADRRQYKRLSCSGGAEFHEVGNLLMNTAMVSDICVGGCYIETRVPLAVESRMELTLRIDDFEISGTAEVRICHPGMGMGVAFREMTPENRRLLEDLIEKLAGPAVQHTPPATAAAKDSTTMELLLFLVDTLKEKGMLTPEEHGNAVSRARKKGRQNRNR
jgi:hypothetical protein